MEIGFDLCETIEIIGLCYIDIGKHVYNKFLAKCNHIKILNMTYRKFDATVFFLENML